MGQYYMIVNVDKKLYISPWDMDNGSKLMEWSYSRNAMVLALMNLLANEWKGDRVYVVGDYAEADNPNEPCYGAVKVLEEELKLSENEEVNSIYGYVSEYYTNVSALTDEEDHGLRYIYNHKTEQFIDTEKCPIEWAWYSKDEKKVYISKIAPISLLLAMGNDRGGGDFNKGHIGYEYVGSWCSSVQDIEVTADKIEGLEYEEFAPNFTEQKEIVPYTDEEKVIREEMKKYAELR